MPRFSVCIPAYKARFLNECITSVLAQTVADLELVILNDRSPEPVKAVVDGFGDPRIRYDENPRNVGGVKLTDNWNRCLSLARGEYIVMMGDDDRMDPRYLETFAGLIDSFPMQEVYHCRSLIIDDDGKAVRLTPSAPSYERVCDHIWHRLNQWRSQYISDFVYRTETLRQRGGYYALPLAWGSDDITAYLAAADKGIAHTNEPVFHYRSNGLSISSSGNELEKMRANTLYAQWLRGFLAQHEPHASERVVYETLCAQQDELMRQRKRYTMALSMARNGLVKSWFWFRHRQAFGLRPVDIAAAAFKAQGLKRRLTD